MRIVLIEDNEMLARGVAARRPGAPRHDEALPDVVTAIAFSRATTAFVSHAAS